MNNNKNAIHNILIMAKENGYRVFENTRFDVAYGWMITPNNNILYLQCGNFGYGFEISLEYKPSRNNGSGCRCNADTLINIDINVLKAMETEGIKFALKLKAKFYTTEEVENYFINNWDKTNIIEL